LRTDQRETVAFLPRLLRPPGGGEGLGQAIPQRQQVARVEAGVVEELGWKGALPPVGPLMPLVDVDPELFRQEIAESVEGAAQSARGHTGVKKG
jgi:hypothetical protein